LSPLLRQLVFHMLLFFFFSFVAPCACFCAQGWLAVPPCNSGYTLKASSPSLVLNGLPASTRSDQTRPDLSLSNGFYDLWTRSSGLTVDRLGPKVCLRALHALPAEFCSVQVHPLPIGTEACAMEPREGRTCSVACEQVPGTLGGSLCLTACRPRPSGLPCSFSCPVQPASHPI